MTAEGKRGLYVGALLLSDYLQVSTVVYLDIRGHREMSFKAEYLVQDEVSCEACSSVIPYAGQGF